MFSLNSEITVGGHRFGEVNEVRIRRGIYELAATATVKVPVTAVLRQKDTPPTRVETARTIRRGDPVTIRLGYGTKLYTEFRGYVRNIKLRTPLEIECEDEFYTCRQRTVRLTGTTALSDLLQKCGLTVGYAEPLTLKNFTIAGTPQPTVAQVLARLRTSYGLNLFFGLDGKVYACRPERVTGDKVVYDLRRNVIDDDNLQYHDAQDVKLRVKAVGFKKDGTKIEAEKGDPDGTVKTLYFYDVEDARELSALADRELERLNRSGYEGSLTAFLQPYAAPCMVAEIRDRVYGENNGEYYIESVETTFGRSGGRRKIELGLKR